MDSQRQISVIPWYVDDEQDQYSEELPASSQAHPAHNRPSRPEQRTRPAGSQQAHVQPSSEQHRTQGHTAQPARRSATRPGVRPPVRPARPAPAISGKAARKGWWPRQFGRNSIAALVIALLLIVITGAGATMTIFAAPGKTTRTHDLETPQASTSEIITSGLPVNGTSTQNQIMQDQSFASPVANCTSQHIVVMGETLSSIAADYNLDGNLLASFNNVTLSDQLVVGQRICLPPGATLSVQATPTVPAMDQTDGTIPISPTDPATGAVPTVSTTDQTGGIVPTTSPVDPTTGTATISPVDPTGGVMPTVSTTDPATGTTIISPLNPTTGSMPTVPPVDPTLGPPTVVPVATVPPLMPTVVPTMKPARMVPVGKSNLFPAGQCTWWANQRYSQFHHAFVPWTTQSDAWQWTARAKDFGWQVSTVPQVGDIIDLQPNVQLASSLGHVGVVERILPNGHVVASNLNWGVHPASITNVEFTPGKGITFIRQ